MDQRFDRVEEKLKSALAVLEKTPGAHDARAAVQAALGEFEGARKAHYEAEQAWANLPRPSSPPPLA